MTAVGGRPYLDTGQYNSKRCPDEDVSDENRRALGAQSIRLPASTVEPIPIPLLRMTPQPDRASLPVRSPGQHLHPCLCRSALVDLSHRARSSA